MLRVLCMTLFIFLAFILQSSSFGSLALGGVVPNLLVILTASYGFMRGEKSGLFVGLICGFLCDVCFGDMLGFYALLYMYIGFLNGKFYRVFYPEDIKLPLLLISVSDITFSISCYLLLFLLNGKFQFLWYTAHVILPELLFTILATILFYPILLLVNTLLEKRERKREQKFV